MIYRYPRGVFPFCRKYGGSSGNVIAKITPKIIANCKALNDCSSVGVVHVFSDGNTCWAVSGNTPVPSSESFRKLFHSRPIEPIEPEEIKKEEKGFEIAIFIQDVSGSMNIEDNAGVYELLQEKGVGIAYADNEEYIAWFSLYGTLGTKKQPPPNSGLDKISFGDGQSVANHFTKKTSYVIGASIDESSEQIIDEIPLFNQMYRSIKSRGVKVKPVLFAAYAKDAEDRASLMEHLSLAPDVRKDIIIVDYNREWSVDKKAQLFLNAYKKAGYKPK